ncbi:MAG: hypothetical protein AB7I25_13445 [Vicinamibacterales bacterium]
MDPAVTPAAPSAPPSAGGVVFRALFVGIVMAVLGGRMAAPVILAGATSVLGGTWFGRWFAADALPAILVAGVALLAGAAVARVSGARARLGVAAYAALAGASGVPQLLTQVRNAAGDARYAGGAGATLGNIVLAIGCVVLGGWLAAGPRWAGPDGLEQERKEPS